ncbi:MAG TPA: helix-turn-helix domain-containing protein [Pseudomonadota bacterium]|nr:helix-turn-helix domain-containing protein [Pseudomonadota bacterium]
MSRKPAPDGALYVRLPTNAVDKLDRAAQTLGVHKKDLIAGLVTKYVDPDSVHGLDELGQLAQPRRPAGPGSDGGTTLGSYSFRPYELPEVLTAEQAGQFLQIPESVVLELAEAGRLPGRKLGAVWRFARAALVDWLARP